MLRRGKVDGEVFGPILTRIRSIAGLYLLVQVLLSMGEGTEGEGWG